MTTTRTATPPETRTGPNASTIVLGLALMGLGAFIGGLVAHSHHHRPEWVVLSALVGALVLLALATLLQKGFR